jgi:hypothetical protein
MMKIEVISVIFGSFFLVLGHCAKDRIAPEIEPERAELENYLRTAKVVNVEKEALAGRTAAWTVSLDDGKVARPAVFKHVHRPRPALLPDSYTYELAAFELSKLLHFSRVPPAVEREIESVRGSLQLFLKDCISEKERKRKKIEPPDPDLFQRALEEVAIFESLVSDECGDASDTLIHKDTWEICRVDFSEAFDPLPALAADCPVHRCSKGFYQKLSTIEDETIRARLKPYLNKEESKALLARRQVIVEKIRLLIKEKGEAAVLF